MIYQPGTKVKIIGIQKRDYMWIDGEFDYISTLLNGKEGIIKEYHPALPEYSEKEAYLISIETTDGLKEYEIELDEFEIIE